jgi:hypothetical protein
VVAEQQAGVAAQRRQVELPYAAVERAKSSGSAEQEYNARISLQQHLTDLTEQESRLRTAMSSKLEADREITQQTLAFEQQKLNILQQESQAIAQARQQEQARVQAQREHLGLMHPLVKSRSTGSWSKCWRWCGNRMRRGSRSGKENASAWSTICCVSRAKSASC